MGAAGVARMRVDRDDNLVGSPPAADSRPTAEGRLVERLRCGDAAAGHEFVGTYYPGVYRYLLYLTGSRDAAEDLTQETFLKAWRGLEGFQGRASLRLWLHRIARREFLQAVRRRNPEPGLEELPDVADPRSHPCLEAIAVRDAMARLAIGEREIVVLHYLHGYDCEEIAQIVASPVGTVKHRLAQARSHLQRELGEGDLAYLNEPLAPMRQWAWLPLDQIFSLQVRLTRQAGSEEARGRESDVAKEGAMERREFLRLAAGSAAGLMLPEAEREIVDGRLTQKVGAACKATALTDVCDRLRAETKVELVAGASVADEKVTLFCKGVPLREVMRQLSRPFGYTWIRSSKGGEYRYELQQDLRSQLLEEELRNRDRNAALLALDGEMSRFRAYVGLSPEEVAARAAAARPEEKALLEKLAGKAWGPIQIYFRLTPDDLAALRAGQTVTLSVKPEPGQRPLPPELVQNVLQTWSDWRIRVRDGRYSHGTAAELPDGLPPASVPEAIAQVQLTLHQSELGQFTLEGGSGFTYRPNANQSGTSIITTTLAAGTNPAVGNPNNRIVNAKLSGDTALRRQVSIRPEASCGGDAETRGRGDAGKQRRDGSVPASPRPRVPASEPGDGPVPAAKVTSADVLEALHRATGLPIVADYYTRLYGLTEVAVQETSLFEALNQLADTMHLRWMKEGNWLEFRSASYYDDRVKEVPNRLLAGWSASRSKRGMLPLDGLVEMAQLKDPQLDSDRMAEGARLCFGLAEWDLARYKEMRPALRYLAGLTPAQRQQAESEAGLAFAQLPPAQQQALLAFLFHWDDSRLQRQMPELPKGVLQIVYTVPGGYQWQAPQEAGSPGWRRLLPAPVRAGSREAALEAARRIQPAATAAQVVPTELRLTLLYKVDGRPVRMIVGDPVRIHVITPNASGTGASTLHIGA